MRHLSCLVYGIQDPYTVFQHLVSACLIPHSQHVPAADLQSIDPQFFS